MLGRVIMGLFSRQYNSISNKVTRESAKVCTGLGMNKISGLIKFFDHSKVGYKNIIGANDIKVIDSRGLEEALRRAQEDCSPGGFGQG